MTVRSPPFLLKSVILPTTSRACLTRATSATFKLTKRLRARGLWQQRQERLAQDKNRFRGTLIAARTRND